MPKKRKYAKSAAKKSGIAIPDVRRWLEKIKYAEKVRDEADQRYGYTRALREYAGDYQSTMPTWMANVPMVPINEVFGYVKAFIPSVYSRNPHISFNAHGKSSIASSKVLEAGVNAYWRELRLKRQIRRCIFDGIFAEGWFKTGFASSFGSIEAGDGEQPLEANEFMRDGEVFGTRVSWRLMVRDPDAVDGISDARWVAQKIIKPYQAVLDSDFYTAKDIQPTREFDPTAELMGKRRPIGGNTLSEPEQYVELYEVWDMDNNEVCWVSEGCDEYLRKSADWPYKFNGYPFDLLRFNQLEDECYAPNLIAPWEPQLWEKIKIRSMQMDHLKRFNRQMFVEEGSLSASEKEKYTRGQTGALIEVKGGKIPPQPIQYPQIQTDMYGIENRVDMDKDNISGQPNAVRSAPQKTQSRTLGEINTMVAAFQARQVDPQSEVEDFCENIAIKLAAVMQEYLTGEKLVQVTQEDLPALVAAFGQDRFDGNYFKFSRKDIAGAEFSAEVKAGSTLPLDRQGKIDALVNILKLGPTIGVVPGSPVANVIGKNILSEYELKEVEIAYETAIAEQERMKTIAKAGMRLEQAANEDKIAKMRAMLQGGGQKAPAPGGPAQ